MRPNIPALQSVHGPTQAATQMGVSRKSSVPRINSSGQQSVSNSVFSGTMKKYAHGQKTRNLQHAASSLGLSRAISQTQDNRVGAQAVKKYV